MQIADRIGALERALKGPQDGEAPVYFISLDDSTAGGPSDRPLRVEHGGQAWEQEPGEDIGAFRARVLEGALAMPKVSPHASPVSAVFLLARRVTACTPDGEPARPAISGGKVGPCLGTIGEDSRRAAPPSKKG